MPKREKGDRKSQWDTTPGAASRGGKEKRKGKGEGQPKRRFSADVPPTVEAQYLAFERLVTRTRRMGAQLDREEMEMGQMSADERAMHMMFGGGTLFDFSEDEGRKAPEPVFMETHEAKTEIERRRRLADTLYRDFSNPEYPYAEVAEAARKLYGPGERETDPMSDEVRAKYADATDALVKHSGPWDADLDPTKPVPEEKK